MPITFGANGIEFSSITNYGAPISKSTSSITCNEKRFRFAVAFTSEDYLAPDTPHTITISNNKVDEFDSIITNIFSNHPTVFIKPFKIRGNDDEFSVCLLNLGSSNITNNIEISVLIVT